MRFLTPTENKRLNELIGFLCITLAVLMGLALISYSPRDAAFNVSGPAVDDHPARNWIGPVGAYTSDLLFQVFGFAAFLLPVALGILGWKWIRSRTIDSQWATITGYVLLLMSLPSLLSLSHFPEVRGAVPAGGLAGYGGVARAAVRIQLLGSGVGGGGDPDRGVVPDDEFFV